MSAIQENKITTATRHMLLAIHDLAQLAASPRAVPLNVVNCTEDFIRRWFHDFIDQVHEIQDKEIGSHANLYNYIDLEL